ncbi:hypothetical protein DOY81_000202 [Sarcophaga bullata]|nr:hypothetical protein DOY81_000202 [Sarcophaga bullata]
MIVIKRHFLFCCHKTSDDYFGVTAAVIIETGFFSYDNFEVCVESQNKILKFIKQLTKKLTIRLSKYWRKLLGQIINTKNINKKIIVTR